MREKSGANPSMVRVAPDVSRTAPRNPCVHFVRDDCYVYPRRRAAQTNNRGADARGLRGNRPLALQTPSSSAADKPAEVAVVDGLLDGVDAG